MPHSGEGWSLRQGRAVLAPVGGFIRCAPLRAENVHFLISLRVSPKRVWRKGKPPTLLVGMEIGAAKNSMEVP